MASIRITETIDLPALEKRWRDLEQRANGSFFQSWTWIGCLFAQRFPNPVLVDAIEAGRTVALGLFNRRRRWFDPPVLYLGESGSAEQDSPFVEQNGILTEAGREQELTEQCLRHLMATHEVVMSGVSEPTRTASYRAGGLVLTERRRTSPFVDLAAIRRADGNYLAARSANTRQQLRRSDRFYQRRGPILLQAATSVATARIMLDRLAELHQKTWHARGQSGSFAISFFRQFHDALIETGWPRNEITLLQIISGDAIIGILYNFIWKRRMLAYQSGFAYEEPPGHAKPGLTCHHQAIRHAIGQDLDIYDFLAGEDRYKRSLADQSHEQLWLHAGPMWSPRLLSRHLAERLRAFKGTHDAPTNGTDSAR